LSSTSTYDVYYSFTTNDGTAESGANDYTAFINQQVRIPAGATIRHAVVPVNNDNMYEPDETFTVQIHNAYLDDISNTALTITNNTATQQPGRSSMMTVHRPSVSWTNPIPKIFMLVC
jgi:hypothetical protein